jgi:Mg-chelatase subunit ChlD
MKRLCLALLLLCLLLPRLGAQPRLEIKRYEVNFPNVRVYFKVACNGINVNTFTGQHFELYENGKLMKSAILHCYDEPDCCISAVLVIDRSGSMTGRLINAKDGAKTFISEMNPDGQPCDEAAIVTFGVRDSLDVPMTTDKGILNAAVDRIVAAGTTAMWDGIATAIEELLRTAKNSCRAVIVLSDGGDNASKQHTLQTVVDMALRDSVRVFTIGLGSASDKNLPALASQTGGKHYQSATGSDLAEIYSAIRSGILGWSFPYCYLEYETDCPDGTERVVELTLKNFCGGTVTQSFRYTAPYLPQLFKPVQLRVHNVNVTANADVVVPVTLETPVYEMFSKASITIGFDENLLEFLDISTDGTLLEGVTLTWQRQGSVIMIRLEEDIMLTTIGGILFNLHFRAKDPATTTFTPIQILDWFFDAYCLAPKVQHGGVRINARHVILSCRTTGPGALRWNEEKKGYEPTSFNVSVTVMNSGNKEIADVYAFLIVDTDLFLPFEPSKPLSPSTIAPSGMAGASWTLELANYKKLRSFPVLFRIVSAGQILEECELFVIVDSALSTSLDCILDMPEAITWNVLEKRYDINPFPVAVTVLNHGNIQARNVRARITFDEAACALFSPLQRTLAMQPINIPAGGRASAEWMLRAYQRDLPEQFTIHVSIESDNMPTIECERIIRIDAARNPDLHCDILVPDSLSWNETLKRYEPNPFDILVTITNTGNDIARDVLVTLESDEHLLRLVQPTGRTQFTNPRDIPRGGSATAVWTVEAREQVNPRPVSIRALVTSENHSSISCATRLDVGQAVRPFIACDLSAPDTVFFRDQYYEPQEFDIDVRVHNFGTAPTRDVRAQLLQDTRFTILSSGTQTLAESLHPGDTASGSFRVRMHARDTDGFDTIWVNIQGDDTDPVWCYHPVWVQRLRMPRFELHCEIDGDMPVFDPATGEYTPNPLRIRSVAVNTGETWAEDCEIMLIGQELLTPVGITLRSAGTMQVNDSRHDEWLVRVLPRNTAAWDTLTLQILGRGGLGKQIVMAECRLPVFVPALREAAYEIACSVTDSVLFRDRRYEPDPFEFRASITNTGAMDGGAIHASLELPPTVLFAQGETPERRIPSIGIGETVDLLWRLRAAIRPDDGEQTVFVRMFTTTGLSASCGADVYIQRSRDPGLALHCTAIDTLFVDDALDTYTGNPFIVRAVVSNLGDGIAEHVQATLSAPGDYFRILDASTVDIGDIDAQGMEDMQWTVLALRQPHAVDAALTVVITTGNHAPLECRNPLYLSANPEPELEILCTLTPPDTLRFNQQTGAYEPSEVLFTMRLRNTGQATARSVRGTVLLPEAMALAPGETAIKAFDGGDIPSGGSGDIQWRVLPIRSEAGGLREFRGIAGMENGPSVECMKQLHVQGIRRHVTLTFPDNSILRHGDKRAIPLWIDRTVVARLTEYQLRIEYDPALLRIHNVSTLGTLTANGWVGAALTHRGPGLIDIGNYTTGSPLATEAGVLLYLQVEAILERSSGPGAFGETALRIDPLLSMLDRGAISYETHGGRVIVTDDCLEPLVTNDAAALQQNRPNPFNPVTVIEYSVPADEYLRLRVFDRHGREIATLADGLHEQGRHAVTFDAERLPSGMYFYRLETQAGFITKKMMLMR